MECSGEPRVLKMTLVMFFRTDDGLKDNPERFTNKETGFG